MGKAIHANDKGLAEGDKCYYLSRGWLPVPCVVVAKHGQGMTRSFVLETEDKTFGRGWDYNGYTPNEWEFRFVAGVKSVQRR